MCCTVHNIVLNFKFEMGMQCWFKLKLCFANVGLHVRSSTAFESEIMNKDEQSMSEAFLEKDEQGLFGLVSRMFRQCDTMWLFLTPGHPGHGKGSLPP